MITPRHTPSLHKYGDDTTCLCAQGDRTTDRLLNDYTMTHTHTHTQRDVLKQCVLKNGNWPNSKQELITNYMDSFKTFIESIDFDLL
jgi:hypothetical protein